MIETTSFKRPSAEELAHDYLWRIHKAVRATAISAYSTARITRDVLVVRVMKMQPEDVWRPRYEEINAFEKHLTENRVIF